MQNLKPLASPYSWVGQFESYRVANPETGFLVTWLIFIMTDAATSDNITARCIFCNEHSSFLAPDAISFQV